MVFEEISKYLGIMSFLLTWAAISYVLLKNPRQHDKSISHHAAGNLKPYLVFATLITLGLVAMLGFLISWLVPILNLNIILITLFLLALGMELLTTWIPLKEGRGYDIHNFLSYGTALLMPIIVLGITLTNVLSGLALLAAYLSFAVMVILLIVFFTIPKALERYLIYQSIYVAAFQLALIGIPFLR